MTNKNQNLTKLPDEFLTLEDILESLKNGKWIILISFILLLVGSIVYYNYQDNIYSSTVKLLYSKQSSGVSLFSSDFGGSQSRALGNELEVIKTRQFGLLVTSAMAESLKTNPNLSKYPLFEKIQQSGRSESILSAVLNGRNATSPRALDIINISFNGLDPVEAALVANMFASVYINNDMLTVRASQIAVKNFIKEQFDKKERELKSAEHDIQQFMLKSGVITIGTESQSIVSNIANLETRINEARLNIGIMKQQIKTATDEMKRLEPNITDLSLNITDNYIANIQRQIAQYESERDLRISASPDKNDMVVRAIVETTNKTVANLKAQLNQRILENYSKGVPIDALSRFKEIGKEKITAEILSEIEQYKIDKLLIYQAELEKKFEKIPQKNIEFARLERNKKSAEDLYLLLEKKYQESLIAEQQVRTGVKIIDPAIPSFNPIEPQRTRMIITLSILGILLGIGISVGIRKLDTRVHKIEDVEKLGINILGQIPLDEAKQSTGNVLTSINTLIQEMYRHVAVNINYTFTEKRSEKCRVLLTTSTVPQEGKTFSAILLAAIYADLGHKVLLIDGDLRRPTIDKNLPVHKLPGLTELLTNNQSKSVQTIHSFHDRELDVITSGTIPVNPIPIISSELFERQLSEFKKLYDVIIIDSPPSLSVSDVQIYAEYVDRIVYVIGAEIVHKKELVRQFGNLSTLFGPKLVGAVLNKVKRENMGRQEAYYYYSSNYMT